MGESSTSDRGGWDSSECTGTPYCQPRCPRFVDKQGDHWTLRQVQQGDAGRLAEMYDTFGPADRAQGIPPAVDHKRESWIGTLLSEGYNIVAEGHDGIVGHVVYTPADAVQPELAVFVHPEFHNRGIGTELCKHAAAAAVAAGCEAIELHVEQRNRAAVTVYRRIGFDVVDSDLGLQMVLPLDESIAKTVRAPPADRETDSQ